MSMQGAFSEFETCLTPVAKDKLQSRFIIPPFSVLDARQGYWQERKRLWLSLGVKSEVGRDNNLTYTGKVADIHAYDGQSKVDRYSEAGRDPNLLFKATEITSQNLNYYREKTRAEAEDKEQDFYDRIVAQRGGGTSIFDPVLCELCYKWFCPQNGMVLDPFAGGSVRGIVAHILGYQYWGIDLSEEQIKANEAQAESIISENKPNWIVGDSVNMWKLLPSDYHCDFIFSCPPYYDLEQYTDNKRDLSNMSWQEFKKVYDDIIYKAIQCLRPNRFACFVVSEIRDNKGYYRGFVPHTIEAFKKSGMKFYNEMILVTQVGSMPIRIAKMFGDYRKIGRVHQNVLVFYNGSVEHIPKYFNQIETELTM